MIVEGDLLMTMNQKQDIVFLNAWTPRMSLEVRDALHAAAGDDEVRVIILTGAPAADFAPGPICGNWPMPRIKAFPH